MVIYPRLCRYHRFSLSLYEAFAGLAEKLPAKMVTDDDYYEWAKYA